MMNMEATKKSAIDPMNARRVEEIEKQLIELDKQFERCNKLMRPRALSLIQSIKLHMLNLENNYVLYITNQLEDGKSVHLDLASDGAAYFFNKDAINEKLPELVFRAIGNTQDSKRMMDGMSYGKLIRDRIDLRVELAALTGGSAESEEVPA